MCQSGGYIIPSSVDSQQLHCSDNSPQISPMIFRSPSQDDVDHALFQPLQHVMEIGSNTRLTFEWLVNVKDVNMRVDGQRKMDTYIGVNDNDGWVDIRNEYKMREVLMCVSGDVQRDIMDIEDTEMKVEYEDDDNKINMYQSGMKYYYIVSK